MKESFRDFMWRALYHPEKGYYAARIGTVGRRGDFSTSATLSDDLATGIARWLVAESKLNGVQTVIEIGSGDGSLLDSVMRKVGWWQRLWLRFLVVETSAPLRSQQQARLGKRCAGWLPTMEDALDSCDGRALIFHNEVMDAFPVRLLEWQDEWKEVHLDWQNGAARETLEDFPSPDSSPFSALQPPAKKGCRIEQMEDLHQWFITWLPHWKGGSMLGIDYGEEFPAIYHRRPRGTLRGYLMQQRVEGSELYLNAGRQDLTADVNFTDVRHWLRAAGVDEVSTGTQSEFLHCHRVKFDPRFADAYASFRYVWSRR